MNVSEFINSLKKSGEMEKLAAAAASQAPSQDEELKKLAANLEYSGKIFGHYVVEGILEKLAQEPVSAQGAMPSSAGNEANDAGAMFKRISDKIMKDKGYETPGSAPGVPSSDPLVRAETTAPAQVEKPNPPEKVG